MAIARKGKRSIVVDGEEFLWWVARDGESPDRLGKTLALHVVDTAGELCVKYTLWQPYDQRHVVVIGRRFRNEPGCGGAHRRFRCPEFGDSNIVYPSAVAELIRWCIADRRTPPELDG